MIAIYTPPQRTILSWEQAVATMRWALNCRLTTAATDHVLALALAKTALETGNWKKMWCFNWGNLKSSQTQPGMWTAFPCGEELKTGSWTFTPAGVETCVGGPSKGTVRQPVVYSGPPSDDWHPQTRFRAFANEFDGVDQYCAAIELGRYAPAWKRLLAGDAVGYVHELKRLGYMTASETQYRDTVVRLAAQFGLKLRGMSHESIDVDPDLLARVEAHQQLWFDGQLHQERSSERSA
jgi:hypothetical protein